MTQALEAVTDALHSHSVSPSVADRVVLVAGEVLANAVEHGGEHPDHAVRVAVDRQDGALVMSIWEASKGVPLEAIRRAMLPIEALAQGGRGLFLIRTLSDDIATLDAGGFRYTFRPRS